MVPRKISFAGEGGQGRDGDGGGGGDEKRERGGVMCLSNSQDDSMMRGGGGGGAAEAGVNGEPAASEAAPVASTEVSEGLGVGGGFFRAGMARAG